MKTMRIVAPAILAAGLAAAIGWRLHSNARKNPDQRPGGGRGGPVAVEWTAARVTNVAETVWFTGTIQPAAQFVVSPRVPGRLKRLAIDVSDLVRQGQEIAALDDEEYVQQLEQARAELVVAEANVGESLSALAVASNDYDRIKALVEGKIAPKAECDTAEAQYLARQARRQVAQAQVLQRQAAVKAAEVRLDYTRIKAEWNDDAGAAEATPRVVGERFVDDGATLRANDPIVSILDIRTVKAIVHATEREYPKVRAGQAAAVATDGFPGREFAGQVSRIAPLLKAATREAAVEILVPNPDRLLKPGMFVRARMTFATHERATVIPRLALVRREGREGVFLANLADKRARFVPLRTGIAQDGWIEVLDTALPDPVVTLGQHLLEDGAAIRLADETGSPRTGPGKPDTASQGAAPAAGRSARP
jgi:RND family efflux transporter MFP subunit